MYFILRFTLLFMIAHDQYPAYHSRPQQAQSTVSPKTNQNSYRQQHHRVFKNNFLSHKSYSLNCFIQINKVS